MQTKDTPRILILSNDLENAGLLETLLQRDGFEVKLFSQPSEVHSYLDDHHIDMLVLDTDLSANIAFEQCERFKEKLPLEETPIIFISSEQEIYSKIAAFELGAVDYLTKPFNRLEILARIRIHLRHGYIYRSLVETQIAKLGALKEAQKAILPLPEDLPKANFSVFYQAKEEAGGDFYDVLEISPGITDYVVADVSGHDLGSSLATSSLKALLHQNMNLVYPPGDSLQIINRILKHVLPDGKYLSLAYLRLNRSAGRVTIISAGHPPVLFQAPNSEVREIKSSGDLLGIFFQIGFDVVEFTISKGDRFFLYTDGLIESSREGKIQRADGLSKLKKLISLGSEKGIKEIVTKVKGETLNAKGIIEDDVLFMAIEV